MKQIIRSFSIGLFAAGIIMLFVFYFSGNSTDTAEDLELDELVPLVEDKGYRVVTEEDYIALSVETSNEDAEDSNESTKESNKNDKKEKKNGTDKNNNDEGTSEKNDKEDSKDEKSDDKPIEYTLQIDSGMASSEIGSILAENDIIDDAQNFTNYLEEHDYSIEVKAGEHDVSSDMSFYELAEAIVSY